MLKNEDSEENKTDGSGDTGEWLLKDHRQMINLNARTVL